MRPGQHQSAGKAKSGRSRHGDTWLQRHLAIAAIAAARSQGTHLAAPYGRPATRRGKAKARKAVGHSILVACFHITAGGVPYPDPGADYLEQTNSPKSRAPRHLNHLPNMGWTITDTNNGAPLPPPHAAA